MKILNLYCGIGGNRKLWGDRYDITAVEINPNIAKIYKDLYPNDNVIIDNAHEYLRKNFREFDFIWSSPPCITHSNLQMFRYYDKSLQYPDMSLYQEIILLKTFYKGNWVIENTSSYYKPLIDISFKIGRHYFWSNKVIVEKEFKYIDYMRFKDNIDIMSKYHGVNLDKYKKDINIKQVLRNCVDKNIGKYILEQF